jgi:RNA polymerase sigma-70 factor (ECF subfamily)
MEDLQHRQDLVPGGPAPPHAASDEALLATAVRWPATRAGREAASRLLARYQDRVYAWCYRHVRERELALDLAQEVLISAYRNLDGFDARARFGSWLFAIARNRCLSELRRSRPASEDHLLLEIVADRRPGPDRVLEQKLDEDALLELVRRHLDPVEQEALWLRCFERLPVDEITRMLRIPEATGARAVLQRARRKLRAALARREEEGTGNP